MAGEVAVRIGAQMRARREELCLNQREVADRINVPAVSNQRISDWERGVYRPSERYLPKIAEALETDVSYFYTAPARETPDLNGALSAHPSQLDRIEAKLDILLAVREPLADGDAFGVRGPGPEVLGPDAQDAPPSAQDPDEPETGEEEDQHGDG